MGECSCIYVPVNDGDLPDFCTVHIRRARKEHKCYECAKIIPKGDQYEVSTTHYRWSSKGFFRYKVCLTCVMLRTEFFCDGFYFGSIFDDLREHVFEHNGAISEDCIARLPKPAREVLCTLIEEYWERYEDDEE